MRPLTNCPCNTGKTQGNFVLIKTQFSSVELEARLLDEGIMVRDVTSFGAPDCIRITIGNREANRALISALNKVLKNE